MQFKEMQWIAETRCNALCLLLFCGYMAFSSQTSKMHISRGISNTAYVLQVNRLNFCS